MKIWKSVVIGTAICGLFTCASCKKSEKTPETEKAAAAADIDAVSQSLKKWDKAEVNSLLRYIPADTLGYAVSTRNISVDDPRIDKLSKNMADSLRSSKKAMGVLGQNAAVTAIYDEYISFTENMKTEAPKWGISLKSDSVAYLDKKGMIFKCTVADSKILKNRLESHIKKINEADKKPLITSKEVKDGDTTWSVYTIDKNSPLADELDTVVGTVSVHYGSAVVTVAMSAKELTGADLAAYLKPAAKSIQAADIDTSKDAVVYGHMDNTKIMDAAKVLLKDAAAEDPDIKEFLSDDCVNDFNVLLKNVPSTEYVSILEGNNELRTDIRLTVADKKILEAIRNIQTPTLHMPMDKSNLSLFVNFNVKNFVSFMTSSIKDNKKTTYKCPMLKDFNDIGSIEKDLNELVSELQIIVDNVAGIGIVVNKLNLEKEQIEVAAAVSGTNMTKVFMTMLKEFGPMLDDYKHLIPTDENVKHFDTLDPLLPAETPIKGNSVVTDNAVIIATEPIDIKTVKDSPMKKHDSLIDLRISGKMAGMLTDGLLGDDTGYHIAAGADEKGLFMTMGVLY